MKIGVVSRIGEFPEQEWEEEFEIFGNTGLGADHLELIINYPYLGPEDFEQGRLDEQLKKLRQYSERYNLELIMHLLPNQYGFSPGDRTGITNSDEGKAEYTQVEARLHEEFFNIASLNPEVRERSKQEILLTLQMAQILGAKLITIHGGSFESEKNITKHFQAARRTLEELNPKFKDVKLAIENLPQRGYSGQPMKEIPKRAEEINYLIRNLENIGLTLDIGHANTTSEGFEFVYQKIKSWFGCGKIFNMHVHDNNGQKDEHLAFGRGNIDLKEFLRTLKQDDYQGFFSVELDTWDEPPEPMAKHERISALRYLKKLITD